MSISVGRGIVLCAILMTLLAAKPLVPGNEATQVEIFNGTVPQDGPARWSTVLIHDAYGRVCTGTLISEQDVLTSAHCFGRTGVPIRVVFHPEYAKSSPANECGVKAFVRHPEYSAAASNRENAPRDLAIVRLNCSAGEHRGYQAVAMASAFSVMPGAPVELAGFGRSTQADQSRGRLLRAGGTVVSVDLVQKLVMVSAQAGQGTCRGDSGGGAFIAKGERRILAGVLVGGEATGCESSGVYVMAGAYREWLQSQAGGTLEFEGPSDLARVTTAGGTAGMHPASEAAPLCTVTVMNEPLALPAQVATRCRNAVATSVRALAASVARSHGEAGGRACLRVFCRADP